MTENQRLPRVKVKLKLQFAGKLRTISYREKNLRKVFFRPEQTLRKTHTYNNSHFITIPACDTVTSHVFNPVFLFLSYAPKYLCLPHTNKPFCSHFPYLTFHILSSLSPNETAHTFTFTSTLIFITLSDNIHTAPGQYTCTFKHTHYLHPTSSTLHHLLPHSTMHWN